MSDPPDALMPDALELNEHLLTEQELDEKFPNRPRNHGATLAFHDLYTQLFNPLNENKKKATGPVAIARRKQGPHGGPTVMAPHERRRQIIERFIARWRNEVGPDIYPAFRLILPDKDRDRPMYGLKEKAIGKLLVKAMRINPNSEDGFALLNFKLPGPGPGARMAGDFAGRCYEVLKKRPMRTAPGDLTIGQVNDMLDQLAVEPKESGQLPLIEQFYANMNATEMMWLVRIILRQMKVGATERTIFDLWHPDAVNLFNVSSSLRRVCWDLHDPALRLEGEDNQVSLMQCFQPQLAQFQLPSFDKMVERMRPTETDDAFWIEEKLDGERMQMHMVTDLTHPGGKRFAFWSRKAKEYTYLYGDGFEDDNSALTRHLKDAFHEGVDNIILDGEMITWDPAQDKMVPFGTLKTAAIAEQRNPFNNTGPRPLYSVFDVLYLNDTVLTHYTLRDRRAALEASVRPVHRRFQIHAYQEAHRAAEIEPAFRKVVEDEAEGLVLKNPRAPYRPNARVDDWMKVKPDYMGFGETPDCVVIGGYYGSGRRGGGLSSFLCGLRLDRPGADPEQCSSFFKVGGGITAQDYAAIQRLTADKWVPWDIKRPPTQYILLGQDGVAERPDVWIRPRDSVVLEVQAASVTASDSFHAGVTLRFPRFKRLRDDRDWTSALSLQGFRDLKAAVDRAAREKQQLAFDAARSRRKKTKVGERPVTVAGTSSAQGDAALAEPDRAVSPTDVFRGLTIYVLSGTSTSTTAGTETETGAGEQQRRTKPQLEALAARHGARITQTWAPGVVCVAERRVVHAAALQKRGDVDLVRPAWLLDSVAAAAADRVKSNDQEGGPSDPIPLPLERSDLFHATFATGDAAAANTDRYGDSFARPLQPEALRGLLMRMVAERAERMKSEGDGAAKKEEEGDDEDDDEDMDSAQDTKAKKKTKTKTKHTSTKADAETKTDTDTVSSTAAQIRTQLAMRPRTHATGDANGDTSADADADADADVDMRKARRRAHLFDGWNMVFAFNSPAQKRSQGGAETQTETELELQRARYVALFAGATEGHDGDEDGDGDGNDGVADEKTAKKVMVVVSDRGAQDRGDEDEDGDEEMDQDKGKGKEGKEKGSGRKKVRCGWILDSWAQSRLLDVGPYEV